MTVASGVISPDRQLWQCSGHCVTVMKHVRLPEKLELGDTGNPAPPLYLLFYLLVSGQ